MKISEEKEQKDLEKNDAGNATPMGAHEDNRNQMN